MVGTSNLGSWNGHWMKLISMISGWWFQPTPLKNDGVSSSVGMMKFPIYIYIYIYIYMESYKSHVPNHQPGEVWSLNILDVTVDLEPSMPSMPSSSFLCHIQKISCETVSTKWVGRHATSGILTGRPISGSSGSSRFPDSRDTLW